jgi:hypothetical protein
MAEILTLEQYKLLAGITNTRNDPKIEASLPALTTAIQAFTSRDFGRPVVTEAREFQYDNSGYLDIDDATAVSSVTAIIPWGTNYLFPSEEWYAQPPRRDDALVYTYLVLPGFPGGASPAMGFKNNADVAWAEGRWHSKPVMVSVAATWGWASIPPDVQMAAKWTLDDWLARRPETAAPAEAIESYSRNFGSALSGEAVSWALPIRARDLLSPYTRINV